MKKAPKEIRYVCTACGAVHRNYDPLHCKRCGLKSYIERTDAERPKRNPLPTDAGGNLLDKWPVGALPAGTNVVLRGKPGQVIKSEEAETRVRLKGMGTVVVESSLTVGLPDWVLFRKAEKMTDESTNVETAKKTAKKRTTKKKVGAKTAKKTTKKKVGSAKKTPAKKAAKKKPAKEQKPCMCGCGALANAGKSFIQGHDMKFKGRVLRLSREQMTWADLKREIADTSCISHYKAAVKQAS